MGIGLGILTFGTLGFVAVFGYLSARASAKRVPGSPKSSLSIDGIQERIAAKAGRP